MNITPEKITHLENYEVFVFGSNESGRHGKGAAKTALQWGAKWGHAQGLSGNTYAIPTKDKTITITLPLWRIKRYADTFTTFAFKNYEMKFLVTEIGCGLAGLNPDQVAPLFQKASMLSNVYLPKRFWNKLKAGYDSDIGCGCYQPSCSACN